MAENTRKKLTMNQQRWIIKRLSLNKKYKDIQASFKEKFGREVSAVTLTRLKNKHITVITDTQNKLVEQGAVQAATLKNQAYTLLQRRMTVAEEDESEIAKLRDQLQRGIITRNEYQDEIKKYVTLSVSELTNIANMSHNHSKLDDETPANPQDRAALGLMLEGIRSGNPVQLVQMFNSDGPQH